MHTMPRLLSLAFAVSLVAGCATNTKLDDSDYRPIGQQASNQIQDYAKGKLNDEVSGAAGKLPKAASA